eukprot:scaffold154393_cov54-Attheya_sp.AAC.3
MGQAAALVLHRPQHDGLIFPPAQFAKTSLPSHPTVVVYETHSQSTMHPSLAKRIPTSSTVDSVSAYHWNMDRSDLSCHHLVSTCHFIDELTCAFTIVGALGFDAWLNIAIEIPSQANIEIPANQIFTAAVDAPPPVSSLTGLASTHEETLPRRSDEREHQLPHAADSYMMDRFFFLDKREIRLNEMLALANSLRAFAFHDTNE